MTGRVRLVPVAVLAGALLAVQAARLQRPLPLREPLETAVPAALLGYVGEDVPLREVEVRSARASEYLARRYLRADSGGAPGSFELHVCYFASSGRDKWKRAPRFCHQEPAWAIADAGSVQVDTDAGPVTVQRYLVQRDRRRALALFWNQARGRIETSPYRLKVNQVRDGILHGRSDEALVRVFVPYRGPEGPALDLAVRVAREAMVHVDRALPAADEPGAPRAESERLTRR